MGELLLIWQPARAGPSVPSRGPRVGLHVCQGSGDVADHAVDGSGSALQRGNRSYGDKPDNQGVFHQVLTFFAHRQGLELYKQSEKEIVHLIILTVFVSRWLRGCPEICMLATICNNPVIINDSN